MIKQTAVIEYNGEIEDPKNLLELFALSAVPLQAELDIPEVRTTVQKGRYSKIIVMTFIMNHGNYDSVEVRQKKFFNRLGIKDCDETNATLRLLNLT